MARRITRKQLKQDEFVSTVDRLVQWVLANWRPLLAGVAVVCVVGVLGWVGWRWSSARVERASYDLHQAISAYEAHLAGGEPGTEPEKVKQELEQVIDRYGRSDQADVARIYLARMELADGRRDAARDLLVEVATRHGNDAIGGLATLDLVDLRAASGQVAEVAGELEAMVTRPDSPLPGDAALYELGELFLRQREPDRAKTYFDKLVEEFPQSPYVETARQRIAELG
jgi:predicted negative regulator of RcsB-dependent stress response